MDLSFWKDKRVFLTGHTGFKGSWLCRILTGAGAELTGYSLQPPTEPNLFSLCGVESRMNSVTGDVRDLEHLCAAVKQAAPEIVIHMAALPIVRSSFKIPAETYETNVMGTVNVLESIRVSEGIISFLNVTTDKVYEDQELPRGYRETDPLDGYDTYSNSKSCSELVTHSYKRCFFADYKPAISTARAGNVIGGGDFTEDRIIPDCVRAVSAGEPMTIRNPASIRPYQHVLEALFAYLMIAQKQYEDASFAGYYNVGPNDSDCVTSARLVELFYSAWGQKPEINIGSIWRPYEAGLLLLDCSKLKQTFGWKPRWNIEEAVSKTVEWTKVYLAGGDVCEVMDKQISDYAD